MLLEQRMTLVSDFINLARSTDGKIPSFNIFGLCKEREREELFMDEVLIEPHIQHY